MWANFPHHLWHDVTCMVFWNMKYGIRYLATGSPEFEKNEKVSRDLIVEAPFFSSVGQGIFGCRRRTTPWSSAPLVVMDTVPSRQLMKTHEVFHTKKQLCCQKKCIYIIYIYMIINIYLICVIYRYIYIHVFLSMHPLGKFSKRNSTKLYEKFTLVGMMRVFNTAKELVSIYTPEI